MELLYNREEEFGVYGQDIEQLDDSLGWILSAVLLGLFRASCSSLTRMESDDPCNKT